MKLPADLRPHFPHTALLVIGDSIIARFFIIGGNGAEEVDSLSEPREKRTDSEGTFVSYDGSRHAGPDSDLDDTHRLEHFVKMVAERITALTREHDIAHVHLVMPAEVEHLLRSDLQRDVRDKILHVLHLNVMKENLLDILRRLYPPDKQT